MNRFLDEGIVRGENFNSILASTPGLAQAIADGMGIAGDSLRDMANAGELTITKVLNALINQADVLDAKMAGVPLKVSQAVTSLQNDLLRYIGELDKGAGATGLLANGIVLAGDHIEAIGQIVKIFTEIHIANLIVGFIKSREASAAAAFAARELAAAEAEQAAAAQLALRSEVALAEANVLAQRAMVTTAEAQFSAAQTAAERTLANRALIASLAQLTIAEQNLVRAETLLNASLNPTIVRVGLLSRMIGLLGKGINHLFTGFIGWEIGKAIGEWLVQFSAFERAGIRIAEAFTIAKTGVEGMLDGQSFAERIQQLQGIHAEYNILAEAAVTSASEQEKAQAKLAESTKALVDKQETTFKHLADVQKGLAEAQKAQYDQQLADLAASLADQSAVVLANAQLSEQQKGRAVVDALVKNSVIKLQLIDAFNAEQLAQTAQFFNQERTLKQQQLAATEASEKQVRDRLHQEIQALDAAELEAKRKTYGETLTILQAHVGDLVTARQREADAAKSIDDAMLSSRERAQQAILDIQRLGLNEEQLAQSKQKEADQALADFKAELAKGEGADQKLLNDLAGKAIALISETTKGKYAESKSDWERHKSIAAIEQIQKSLNTELVASKARHDANGIAIDTEMGKAKTGITAVSGAVSEIDQKLVDGKKLAVQVDQASLKAAQSAIDVLTAPETKVIKVVTQNSGDGAPDNAVPAQRTGGLAGQPTGAPWHFAVGGFLRQQGKLDGYGGGDKIRALLEPGEFVVRKEAVEKLGLPVLQAVNKGNLPAPTLSQAAARLAGNATPAAQAQGGITPNLQQTILKFAAGGAVSSDDLDRQIQQAEAQHALDVKLRREVFYHADGNEIASADRIYQDKINALYKARSQRDADKKNNGAGVSQIQNLTGQRTGGLAGQPTGEPWHFAVGGFLRQQGKLDGYGGGDKIRALLEPGEFVVRKEAVEKLGLPVLQAVNKGNLPAPTLSQTAARLAGNAMPAGRAQGGITPNLQQTILKFAAGGAVSSDDLDRQIQQAEAQHALDVKLRREVFYYADGNEIASADRIYQDKINALYKARSQRDADKQKASIAITQAAALNVSDPASVQTATPASALLSKLHTVINSDNRPAQPQLANVSAGTKIMQALQNYPALTDKTPRLTGFRLPDLPQSVADYAAQPAIQSSRQIGADAPGKHAVVEFKFPAGGSVKGQFNKSDVDTLLAELSNAAATSSYPTGGY
ncbi:MAG: tape measure protein [Methylovulum sp.]|nr:tape measure protein [Methylovulum sp.]